MERIVLAYAGGLETSVAIPWLRETRQAEVVAATFDLGQGRDLAAIRERALAAGAVRAHVLDVRAEFADRYVLPALQAGAVYENGYPLATALGRPLLASKLVELARIEGATAIAHCCSGKGNDQVRIEVSARALEPGIAVVAPARLWNMTPDEVVAYAHAHGLPVAEAETSRYNIDTNLWGRSIQSGVLEDPWVEPPASLFTLTADPARCPDAPAYVEIGFDRGVPVAVNGVTMPLLDLIGSLTTIAGSHGVGRLDSMENRLVGIKTREVYEAPAAIVLHQAHRELESVVLPRDLQRVKGALSLHYADLVYNGLWYSPLRQALDAFVTSTQARVSGVVRLKLFKGSSQIVGRQSPFALYDRGLATYLEGDRFDHRAAEGFITIWGLPLESAARHAKAAGAGPASTEAA